MFKVFAVSQRALSDLAGTSDAGEGKLTATVRSLVSAIAETQKEFNSPQAPTNEEAKVDSTAGSFLNDVLDK